MVLGKVFMVTVPYRLMSKWSQVRSSWSKGILGLI